MRILIAHKLPFFEGHAGATRTVRSLARLLADQGHDTAVLCRNSFAGEDTGADMEEHPLSNSVASDRGVNVCSIPGSANFEMTMMALIEEWNPECVIIGEDPTFFSLAIALDHPIRRVVLLAQSQSTLPFGPEAFYPDTDRTALLKPPVEIVVLSEYVKNYIHRWGKLESVLLPHLLEDHLDAKRVGDFDNAYVTFINASQIKGMPIFLELAKAFPSVVFAAVKGWATTADDIAKLEELENVVILEPREDVNEIYAQSRLLLVPSLWGEAFGYVALEAMVRGIPVLASDQGGLPEATLGLGCLLPVRPISKYHSSFDDRLLPRPLVPEQDVQPWRAALQKLMEDRAHYERLADQSRAEAIKFMGGLEVGSWINFLTNN